MGIYTRDGDNGETSELNGSKVSKNSLTVHFVGTVDELNCHIGLIKAMISNEDAWQLSWHASCRVLEKIQKNMMKIMSHVSDVKNSNYFFNKDDVAEIEKEIEKLMANKPRLNNIVIPGKNIIEAQIQICRTVARRAERMFFAVNEKQPLCPEAGAYLNRLSDYLFVLSQQESLINVNFINQITGI